MSRGCTHIHDEEVVRFVHLGVFIDDLEDRVRANPMVRVEVPGGVAIDIVLDGRSVVRSDKLQAFD